MAEKEIRLLREQLSRLNDSNVEFEVWKNQTLIFLERIFGGSSSEVKLMKEVKNDYSSWNLRDATGKEKSKDPARSKAAEILTSVISEIEMLGLPKEPDDKALIKKLLEDELTGKQIREIDEILNSDLPDKEGKLKDIIEKIGQQGIVNIIIRALLS
jgi:hypothetical protein